MFKKITILFFISILIAFVGTMHANESPDELAEAQKKLEEAAREYAELSSEMGGNAAAHILQSFNFSDDDNKAPKARLGINIGNVKIKKFINGLTENIEDGIDSNIDGVKIMGVTPDGPAQNAGLRTGDVITTLNGQTLLDTDGNTAVKQLTDIMQTVTPGDSVSVMYQRDTTTKNVNVVTDEMPKNGIRMMFGDRDFKIGGPEGNFDIDIQKFENIDELKDMEIFKGMGEAWGDAKFIFLQSSPLGDAELVELSPELGDYFGTDEGLLVVKAPSDENIDLHDGDVIRTIDGRTPSTVSHAMRIFRSYEAGETVNLEILRKKRKRKIALKIPEREKSGMNKWHFEKNSSESDPATLQKRVTVIKGRENT